ncbi:MAG: secretin N-terminal domain-containing protein [Candidatus Poribacteria bacterium]
MRKREDEKTRKRESGTMEKRDMRHATRNTNQQLIEIFITICLITVWWLWLVINLRLLSTFSFAAEPVEQESVSTLISMRFKNASLDYVLEFLSDVTGYIIVKDAELNVRVTVISPHDIPVDEAFSVLNSILSVKGYTSIVNEKTVKIVPLESAKQDAIPTQVGSDPAEIKPEDTIVTQVMPLSYADAAQLAKDLKDLVPEYGAMTAYARGNTLIITASSANIKRLAEIIKQLDTPMSDLIKVEVFTLQYADATTLAEVITKLFEKPKDTASAAEQARAQRQRFFRGFRGGPSGAEQQTTTESATGENEMLQLLSEVKAVADKNTNSLIVSASEQNLTIIRELVEKLDKKLFSEPETRLFILKYADATEVANELNQAFSTTARNIFGTTTGFGGGFGRFFGGRQQVQQVSQTNQEGAGVLGLPELVAVPDSRTNSVIVTTTAQQMASIGQLIEQLDRDIADYAEDTRVFVLEHADSANVADVLNELFSTELFERQRSTRTTTSGFFGTQFGGTRGTVTRFPTSQTGALGTAAQTAEEASGLTGNVKVVADEDTNSLLVTTFVKNFPAVEKIIKQIDVLLPQVLIEAQIIEVTLDDESVFGVEWMWEKEKTTINGKDYSQTVGPSFGLTDEDFGLKYGVLSNNLEALLNALSKNTKVNILSTPRIMTQNNQEAVMNVGQEVPYLRSTQETATGGILTSYDYQDVGVILTVTPRINKSGTVSLDVNQQINSLIEFTLFNAPVIAKREASAYVTVKDGQTIIIGGIIKDDKTETVHKTPILGDIPFVGRLFQRRDTRAEMTELMVFITPHVVYTDEDANKVTAEQKSKLSLHNKYSNINRRIK